MVLLLYFVLACFTAAPPDTQGRLIYVDDEVVVIQHDDLRGRIAPGTDHYAPAATLDTSSVTPGMAVVGWWGEDAQGVIGRLEPDASAAADASSPPVPSALTGVVIRRASSRVTVDHEAIPGVMGAMVMT